MDRLLRFIAKTGAARLLLLALLALPLPAALAAASGSETAATQQPGDAGVMQSFIQRPAEESSVVKVADRKKHLILFFMGMALLVFLLVTATLGIAMGVYGKQVFVAHMIFAGFAVTLAIAHSIVAIVWFFPF